MRKILPIIAFAFLSCSGGNQKEIEWTKNGTLHEADISAWKKSTDANKLATCADFVANLKNAENQNEKLNSHERGGNYQRHAWRWCEEAWPIQSHDLEA